MPRQLPGRETQRPYPGHMDEVRQSLATTIASLAKLQLRVYRKLNSARRLDNGHWELKPRWVLAELDPPSPWLDGYPTGMPLQNVVEDIMEAQMYLTAMVAIPDPIDLRLVCRTLHHLSGDPTHWSPVVLRFAKRFDVKLASQPVAEFHGAGLFGAPYPGTDRMPKIE